MKVSHWVGLILVVSGSAGCGVDRETWIGKFLGTDGGAAADAGSSPCQGPNPQGCTFDTDCGSGQRCSHVLDVCVSNSCSCDATTQSWVCTPNCSGGACVPAADAGTPACPGPNPQGCTSDSDCGGGQCHFLSSQCLPRDCACDPSTQTWVCQYNCGAGVCAPPADAGAPACPGPNPQGCTSDSDCGGGQCHFLSSQCLPRACACDPGTQTWVCQSSCGAGVCAPPADAGHQCQPQPCTLACPNGFLKDANGCDLCRCAPADCSAPNPAGCVLDADCGNNERCSHALDVCAPSSCSCDPSTQAWMCTADCGGGACVPAGPLDAGQP